MRLLLQGFVAIGVLVLLCWSWALGAPEMPACKGNPALVGPCFSVRGRMRMTNGGPAIRIWRIGTDRILGVWEPREGEPNVEWIPDAIYKQMDYGHQLFANFEVCPLTRERAGEMQTVCVASATNIRRTPVPKETR